MASKRYIAATALAVVLGASAVPVEAAPSPSDTDRAGNRTVVKAGRAGTVVLGTARGTLRIAATRPTRGWRVVEAQRTGRREVDITFRKNGRFVEVEGVLADGSVTTEVDRRSRPRVRALGTEAQVVSAGPAGSVTVQAVDGVLTIVEVTPAEGYTVIEQRAEGLEVDLTFRSDTQVVELEIDVEDGQLVSDLEIETRDGAYPAEEGEFTVDLTPAGSAVLALVDGELIVVSTALEPGWTASDDLEDDGDELKIRLTDGSTRVKLEAEVDDDEIEVEVEVETEADDDSDDSDDDDEDDDDSDDDDSDEDDDDSDDDEDDDDSDED